MILQLPIVCPMLCWYYWW